METQKITHPKKALWWVTNEIVEKSLTISIKGSPFQFDMYCNCSLPTSCWFPGNGKLWAILGTNAYILHLNTSSPKRWGGTFEHYCRCFWVYLLRPFSLPQPMTELVKPGSLVYKMNHDCMFSLRFLYILVVHIFSHQIDYFCIRSKAFIVA